MNEHEIMRRSEMRAKLRRDTEAWIAQGNEVKQVPPDLNARIKKREDNDDIFRSVRDECE